LAIAGPSPAGRLDELKAKNRLSRRLAPSLLANAAEDRDRLSAETDAWSLAPQPP
jgi:hypothetical protein